MKTKVDFSFNLKNFETISENSESKLVGGFSATFFSSEKEFDQGANNCSGGNCVAGCGNGQNVDCNTVVGCGN